MGINMSKKEQSLGKKIEKRIEELGYTRTEVCEIIGIDKGHLSRIINDNLQTTKGGRILQLCNFLNISIEPVQPQKAVKPEECKILMDVLREVWDGRLSTATVLAEFIKSCHHLGIELKKAQP